MTTRTKQLAWQRLPNGTTTVYTCPSGHRTIVKDVRLYNNDSAGKQMQCFVSNGAGTVYGHIVPLQTVGVVALAAPTAVWAVMEAGQELRVYTAAAANASDCLISGAELSV
jgi:hypothetical protein